MKWLPVILCVVAGLGLLVLGFTLDRYHLVKGIGMALILSGMMIGRRIEAAGRKPPA